MQTKAFFYSDNRASRSLRRKRSKGGGAGHKGGGGGHGRSSSHLEQPAPSQEGTEPCPRCGFPVEARRMHFHMVRVHGAAFRSKDG